MMLIRIPLKILAVVAVIALTVIILLMKLVSHISCFAFIIFAILMGLACVSSIFFMGDWKSLIVAGVFILGAYLVVFLLVGLQMLAEQGRRLLGNFIRSRRRIRQR